MEKRIDILNELQAISPVVAAINKVNVFTVPEGYFERLASDVLMGIGVENGTSQNTGLPSDVPVGYFDNLAASVLNKIRSAEAVDAATEIRAISPMLYSLQNEHVFTIPPGYFENLGTEIVQKITTRPKVVTMQRSLGNFFKYAVAAAFTGVVALSVLKFTGKGEKVVLPGYVTAGQKIQDVDQELAKIADEDIIKYLEANGTDVKTAMVLGSTDNNDLPSQEDYLLDEQALDKYLNSINLNDLKN